MQRPSVVHFKCLDTLGMLSLSRARGLGGAGVRITTTGLAPHVRGMGSPVASPAEVPLVAASAPITDADARAIDALLGEPPIDDETIVAAREEVFVRVAVAPPRRARIPALLRSPTAWGVALVVVGAIVGASIAHAVGDAAPAPTTTVTPP